MPRTRKLEFHTEAPLTDAEFRTRIQELLERASRLEQRYRDGYHYRRVRIKRVKVKAHTRKAHWAMRPVKGEP